MSIMESLTTFMTEEIHRNASHSREEMIQDVGASLLLGMGNMIVISSHYARLQASSDSTRTRRDITGEQDGEKVWRYL